MSSVNCIEFHRFLTPSMDYKRPSRKYVPGLKLKHCIFLMYLLVIVLEPVAVNAGKTCKPWEYLDGRRCKSCANRGCSPGQRIKTPCGNGEDVVCEDCILLAEGYTCVNGKQQTCILCEHQGKKTVQPCGRFSQTVCGGCLDGYFAKATWGENFNCIHCDYDKANNSDCPVKGRQMIDTDFKAVDQEPAKELPPHDKHMQSYVIVGSVTFGAVMLLLLISAILSARFGLYKKMKNLLRRSDSPQSSNSFDQESVSGKDDKASRISGPNSVKIQSECDVGCHEEYLIAQPASASVRATPDFPTGCHDNADEREKLMRKSSKSDQLEGTSSPFRITDDETPEDVFVFPLVTRRDSEDSEASPPSPPVVLPGQTAQVHKSDKRAADSNHTVNSYRTKLANCLQRAYEIPLRDDWFSFDRQQRLSAKLDQIPPAAALPNWRTFFETLGHLEKLDMESVNNARVDSPTLALFKVLETRNYENMLTIGHVLEALDRTRFTGLVDYLCDEIRNTDFSGMGTS